MKKVFFLFLYTASLTLIMDSTYSQKKNVKSDAEWKKFLTPMQYYVLREKGTERPTTGKYNKHYERGVYSCVACNTELFLSENKYDSHSGWPSFDNFVGKNVTQIEDNSFGMKRTEVICSTCEGHLGHVFNDGPKNTTGKRYCINSASLKFSPQNEKNINPQKNK